MGMILNDCEEADVGCVDSFKIDLEECRLLVSDADGLRLGLLPASGDRGLEEFRPLADQVLVHCERRLSLSYKYGDD